MPDNTIPSFISYAQRAHPSPARVAVNLWNGWAEEGAEHQSTPYELFVCALAPFFWEAIKLRYPSECGYYQRE